MNQTVKKLIEICKEEKDLHFFEDIFPDFPELSPRDIKQIKYLAKTKIKGVMELAKILKESEDSEIESNISGLWFELRTEWIRHNAINNYNMVMFESSDTLSLILSSFISHLIERLESLLPPEKVERMHDVMVKIQYNE